ncbi:MAG: sugar transferase [Bacteroidota bacterium]
MLQAQIIPFQTAQYPTLPNLSPSQLRDGKLISGRWHAQEIKNAKLLARLPRKSSFARSIKRLFDISFSLTLLLALSPLLIIISAALLIEGRGPVFYYQERIGRNGKKFLTLKFRTMVVNAEQVLNTFLAKNPTAKAEWEKHFKLKHDPRITRLGHFLRKSSLDELPQLVNVLMGDMSLIGPRPLPQYHHDKLSAVSRRIREHVRPGISGMWQIRSRSTGDLKAFEFHDTYYVSNWTLGLDLKILMKTPMAILSRRGAY